MFTEEEKKRFAVLSKKGAADLTDDEKSELQKLTTKANEAGFEWNEEKKEVVEKQKSISLDDLKKVIETGCKKAFEDFPDDKIKAIVEKALKEQFPDADKKTPALTQEGIESLMTKCLQTIEKKVEDSEPGGVLIAGIDFSKAFEASVKKLRPASKMQHDVTIPDGNRVGNLTVCEKQILNVCLGRTMNDGISQKQIEIAHAKGIRRYENLLEKARYEGRLIDKAAALADLHGDAVEDRISGRIKSLFEEADLIRKDLTTSGSGTGNEFIPSDLSSEMMYRLFLESRLAQKMGAMEINMPTAVYTFPLSTTRPLWKLTAEGGDATKSDPGTGEIVLTAKKLTGYVQMTYEMEEDSIVPMLPFLRQQLGESGAAAYEEALISGDTTATHQDSDINAATAHVAKAWNGFRKLAIAGSLTVSFATGGIAKANLRALRKAMGKYGLRPSQLFFLAGPKGLNDIMGISEVYTRDTFGRPVLEAGDIQRYENIEIIPSELMRENLNASGVYDGSTTTKGSLLLVNGSRFVSGRRREFTLEMDKSIINQTKWLVASYRKAFSPVEAPSATVPSLAYAYNYDA